MINNPWRGLRGLPADVWIIVATSLVNRAGMMALPFLVLYLTKHLGVSATLAGLAITTYGLGGLLTGPIAGKLCDRLGTFTVMRVSLALTGVILLIIPLARDFRLVVLLTFLWAVVADAVRPATLSGLTEMVRPEQRKAAIALNRLAVNLGMSIGPAVGGFLAMVSFPMVFVVDGVTSLLAAGVLSVLLWYRGKRYVILSAAKDRSPGNAILRFAQDDKGFAPYAAHQGRQDDKTSVWHDRAALTFFLAVFLVGLVFMQHQGAMPLYLVRDLHYRESFYGMLFVLNTLLIVAIEVPVNLAMSHWPHRRSLILGAALTACGFGAIGLAHTSLALAATVVLWTFGEMIFFPASTAYVADIAPAGRTGEYMGAFASMFSLSMIVGPWAGTASLDRFGPLATWGSVFACGLLAVGVIAATRHAPLAALSAEPV